MGRPPPPENTPQGPPPPVTGRWPLRGREAALGRATAALASGRGAVLAGEPGVGKTRLAQEVLEAARLRGHPVRWAVATRSTRPIAFGALAHLLPGAAPGRASRLSLLQRSLAALGDLAGDQPLVLGMDDAHLLDSSSSALLHMAAAAANVLVVATARDDAEVPDLVTALWKDGLAERIEVRPLTRQDVVDLAAEVLDGGLDQRTSHLIWRATLGNPLYLREVLLGGLEGGHLRRAEGLWRWRGPLQVGSRLAEVVRGRLGHLGPELRETLEIVAVAQRLELFLIEGLCGEERLREAEREGVVTIERDGRRDSVELAHPLYAEVLRQAIPAHRVQRIMGRLAAALEATGARRRGDLLRSCDWRLQAGLPVPEDVLLAGATQARETGDWRLAERLLGAVRREGTSSETRIVLADALASAGRWAEAETVLEEVDIATLPEATAARALAMRVDHLAVRLGRLPDAELLLERVARGPAGGAPWMAYCRAQLALVRGDAAAAALELPPAPEPGVPDPWLAIGAPARAGTMAYGGDVDGALAVVDRVLAEPEGEEPVYGAWRAVWAFRLVLAVTGGYFDQSPVESIYDAAAAGGDDRLGLWFSACLAGTKAMAAGDAAAARRWAAELAGTTPAMSGGPVRAAGHAVRACLLALVGEVAAAEAALADMEADHTPGVGMFDDDMAAARYAVAAASGDLALAQALALRAADEALELGRHAPVVVHAANAARYGRVGPAADRVRAVAGRLTGPLPTALAGQALAWSRSDAAGLDAVSQRFAAMGAYLPAAEAAVTATRLHQEAGRRTAAAASGARAAELARRCAGCRSPVLEGGPRRWSLTSRELQVARLAAQALGNRQIADRLGVSTRTVETHLHHAYAKLGVAGRSQLRAAFGDEPRQS